ncbi:hypothetical protein DFH09DRAFT_1338421 [Mycena vulgaris]|nr:hypothetical protein DFH09DRAFT_1338421 [Mycena vulgaris]
MAPKRKMDDTTFDSGGSDSDSSINSDSDDVEDQEYYYESIARDVTGRSVYTSAMVNARAAASPSKPVTVYPPRSANGGTWIYDFMDNDWAFSADEGQLPSEDDEPEPP